MVVGVDELGVARHLPSRPIDADCAANRAIPATAGLADDFGVAVFLGDARECVSARERVTGGQNVEIVFSGVGIFIGEIAIEIVVVIHGLRVIRAGEGILNRNGHGIVGHKGKGVGQSHRVSTAVKTDV